MKIRAPPGREESMERTKDFYNGMNYAKKQLQQREHERRRRKRYFIKQKLCGIATFAVLVIVTPFAPLLDLDIITISAFFMPIALSLTSYQNTDGEAAGVEWLEQNTDFNILGIIRYSKKVAENTFLRKPIYEYSPCCAAAQGYKKFVTTYTGKAR